jgi:hypothetical protein
VERYVNGLQGFEKSLDGMKIAVLSFRRHVGILQLGINKTGGIRLSQ